ncbi:hypothetical protein [Nonomuraea endophytica]|uniref:hypothetical protein n=1 Tax=Nonomuraea endophytica TaxID=714136 RepID=UPI0037C782DB
MIHTTARALAAAAALALALTACGTAEASTEPAPAPAPAGVVLEDRGHELLIAQDGGELTTMPRTPEQMWCGPGARTPDCLHATPSG